MAIYVSLTSEDVSVFQKLYSEKKETIDWMLNFGSSLEKMTAEIIKIANEGKTGFDLQVLVAQEGRWNISKRSLV